MKYSILIIIIFSIISCSSPKPRKPVSRSTSTFLKESIERNKAINKLEEDFFRKMMQNDTVNKYYKSDNGFWYFYNNKVTDNIIFPKKGNEVIINYEIRDVNNTIIYAKEELGTKNQNVPGDRLYKVDREEFITGLQEGIKLMHKGEVVTFLFPSFKVFGVSGFQDRIAPNQPLIIQVYLKEIK